MVQYDLDGTAKYGNVAYVNILNNTIKLFPNPVADVVTVTGAPVGSMLKLFSISGQLLVERAIQNQTERINVSQLTSGTYIIHIVEKSGTTKYLKFVKK